MRLCIRVDTNCPVFHPFEHLPASFASEPNTLLSHWLFNRSLTAETRPRKCGYSLRSTKRALQLYESQLKILTLIQTREICYVEFSVAETVVKHTNELQK